MRNRSKWPETTVSIQKKRCLLKHLTIKHTYYTKDQRTCKMFLLHLLFWDKTDLQMRVTPPIGISPQNEFKFCSYFQLGKKKILHYVEQAGFDCKCEVFSSQEPRLSCCIPPGSSSSPAVLRPPFQRWEEQRYQPPAATPLLCLPARDTYGSVSPLRRNSAFRGKTFT